MQEPTNEPVSIEIEQKPASTTVVRDWQSTVDKSDENSQVESEFSIEEKPMAQVIAMPTANSETILADILGETSEPEQGTKQVETKQVEQNPTTDLILSELTQDKVKLTEQQQRSAEDDLLAELQQEQSLEQTPVEPVQESNENSEKDVSMDFFLPSGTSENEPVQQPEDTLDPNLVSSPTESVATEPTYPAYFIDNQKFMSLPADRFVLQLTAVSDEVVLSEYLSSAPVPVEELRIYRIKRKNKDWIVVTYGLFETIEQARQSAKQVEPYAWAKSVSVIQQQILAFQKAQRQ